MSPHDRAWEFVLRHRCIYLVSLIANVLLGCASSPEAPAPKGMRRVFLSSTAATGGNYQSEMLYSGTPTDRFDAKQDRAWLYVVFNDGNNHAIQFTVKRADSGVVAIKSSRMELTGTPRPVSWRGYSAWFQIAGRLPPGAYILDLTIDDRSEGAYSFTVSP